jgi:putative spermidine/putrescine transport system ATP-binding protein
VFQHYALFRHMTVFENIAFPLRVRKAAKAEIKARVGYDFGLLPIQVIETMRKQTMMKAAVGRYPYRYFSA